MLRLLSIFLVLITALTLLPAVEQGEAAPLTRQEARERAKQRRAERLARRRGQMPVSSHASSVSSIPRSPASSASSDSSSSSVAPAMQKVFIPFLERFVDLPPEWAVAVSGEKASFTRTTDGRRSGSFDIFLIPHTQCDTNWLQRDYRKRMELPEDAPAFQVDFVRIGGLFGAGYTWLDGTTFGGNRHWCVIPPRRVGVSHIRADDGEGSTRAFIEKTMLRQLATDPRDRR